METGGQDATDTERIRILSTTNKSTLQSPSSTSKEGADSGSADHRSSWKTPTSISSGDSKTREDYAFYNTAFDSTEIPAISKRRNSVPNFKSHSYNTEMKNKHVIGNSDNKIVENGYQQVANDQKINIQRDLVDYNFMELRYGMHPEENATKKLSKALKSCCSCNISCFLMFVSSLFPVVNWLPKYKLEFLIPDIISGFTIAILHIPQGMAYGILASVKPENGLYVSFFPVLVYFVFGTSRHISIGTFAVISIMVSAAVAKMDTSPLDFEIQNNSTNLTAIQSSDDFPLPTYLEVVTSLALAVGFWQLFMGVFKLGALSVLLSDQLVSGFTTGAAFHVATSQLKDLFGIHVGRHNGILNIVYIYKDLFENMPNSNLVTLLISAIAIFTLALVKEQINERFRDKLKMPLPIDLVVVIIATAVSYVGDFDTRYKVKVMGYIPTGLPEPSPPRIDILHQLLADSFAIAIVAFAISLSMAKLFAKKYKYSINANQELIALGCANTFSSFFACYPCSASLSRSLVQERAGGKTQVAGVISCGLLLLVLLVIAPLFYTLPKCILSAVILVALKGMFLQVKDFLRAWKISKLDALIWLVTFVATILLDVSYGLLAGVIFTVLTVIVRTMMPSKTFLGNIPGTDIYLDMQRYNEAKEIPGIRIFHFESALYFANRELFKSSLLSHVPLKSSESYCEETKVNVTNETEYLIIDCSTFSFIDMSGLETLIEIINEYQEVKITVFLCGCSVAMYDLMQGANFFEQIPYQPSAFLTIHDAVEFCVGSTS